MELLALIGVAGLRRIEGRGANQHAVCEWPLGGLLFRMHAVPDWSALHEHNGVVSILARHGGRKPEDVLRPRCRRATCSKLNAGR